MTPELAIVNELSHISKLKDKIYPLEGLKNASAPFVFYVRRSSDEDDTLDGGSGLLEAEFEIHCVAKKAMMKTVTDELEKEWSK